MNPIKNITIIGLGYVGLPLAVEFGKKYKTIGYDINKTFTVVAEYSYQLSNSTTLVDFYYFDRLKTNGLVVSIQYFF